MKNQTNMAKLSSDLNKNGVVVIPDVFTLEEIHNFRLVAEKALHESMQIINEKLSPSVIDYVTMFDKVHHSKKYSYKLGNGSVLLELAQGRYDFRLNRREGIFASEHFLSPEPVRSLMKLKLKTAYSSFAGALPALPHSESGLWHRDIYPLFHSSDDKTEVYDDFIEVKIMPPFYYTMLTPLHDINVENGSTEFILGSHRLSYEESKNKTHCQFDITPGSVLLFDGRIFHRGTMNQSNEPRMVLYHVFHPTFRTNVEDFCN